MTLSNKIFSSADYGAQSPFQERLYRRLRCQGKEFAIPAIPLLIIAANLNLRIVPGRPATTWLVQFLQHRIADRCVVRLIQKWLNAGVLEKGKRTFVEAGSPQGGSASPLLANLYLHYVFDLWVQAWRRKRAHGDMIVVRYADDIVVEFEFKDEAERFWAELK